MVRFLVWVISAALKPKALLVAENLRRRQELLALHRRRRSNNLVPNSVRLFRGQARQPRNSAHSGDAISDRGVDGPAVGRMLRLGSMATTFSDSRSRQPVWRDVRAPPAASRH